MYSLIKPLIPAPMIRIEGSPVGNTVEVDLTSSMEPGVREARYEMLPGTPKYIQCRSVLDLKAR